MKTELHEKEDCDKWNCHLCPNMQDNPNGAGYECPVCGLYLTTHNDDITETE